MVRTYAKNSANCIKFNALWFDNGWFEEAHNDDKYPYGMHMNIF